MSRLTKQQLLLIAILTALNLLLSGALAGNGKALFIFLINMPVLSAVVGAAVASLPYQDKPYREKFLLYALWILVGMNIFFLVAAGLKRILQ